MGAWLACMSVHHMSVWFLEAGRECWMIPWNWGSDACELPDGYLYGPLEEKPVLISPSLFVLKDIKNASNFVFSQVNNHLGQHAVSYQIIIRLQYGIY